MVLLLLGDYIYYHSFVSISYGMLVTLAEWVREKEFKKYTTWITALLEWRAFKDPSIPVYVVVIVT